MTTQRQPTTTLNEAAKRPQQVWVWDGYRHADAGEYVVVPGLPDPVIVTGRTDNKVHVVRKEPEDYRGWMHVLVKLRAVD